MKLRAAGMMLAVVLALAACPKVEETRPDSGMSAVDSGVKLDAGPSAFTCDVTAQDCEDAGVACVYVDQGTASSCRAGVCDVVTQAGCDPTQKCGYLADADAGTTARGCGPNGTADAGEMCGAGGFTCARGLACIRDTDGGLGGSCHRFCAKDHDCTGTDVCGAQFILYDGTDESPSFCSPAIPSCDVLVSTSCASGLGCYATLRGPECFPAGTHALAASCTFANDCSPGLQCMSSSTGSFCRQVCAFPKGAPTCPAGKACKQTIPGELDAGVCL